jgi:hypothetical protein
VRPDALRIHQSLANPGGVRPIVPVPAPGGIALNLPDGSGSPGFRNKDLIRFEHEAPGNFDRFGIARASGAAACREPRSFGFVYPGHLHKLRNQF